MTIAFGSSAQFSSATIVSNPSCTSALTLGAGDGVEVHVLCNNGNQPTSVADGISGNAYTYAGATSVGGSFQVYTFVCQNANAGSATISVTGTHVFAIKARQITGGAASGLVVAGPVSAYQNNAGVVGANQCNSGNAAVGATPINVLVTGFNVNLQTTNGACSAGTSPLAFTSGSLFWNTFNGGSPYCLDESIRVSGATGNVAATFGTNSSNQYNQFFTIVMVYAEYVVASYTATIKAIAVVSGQLPSTVATAAYTITNPTSSVPAPAAAAGYNTKTFDSTTYGTSIGQLQAWNFFTSSQSGITQNSNGSLTLAGAAAYKGTVSTASKNAAKPAGWQGKAFGGGGYFELIASFPGATTASGDPTSGVLYDIGSSVQDINTQGQMSIEMDGPEFDIAGTSTQYGVSLHNYVYNNGAKSRLDPSAVISPVTIPSGQLGNGTVNTYGFLWIPATSSTQGSATWYFNGSIVKTYSYNQYSAGQAFPPSGSNISNYIDQLKMYWVLQSQSTSQPWTILSCKVWQSTDANNVTY